MTAADDRAEITELLARYAVALDRRELDAVGELFTEDGQATYSGNRLEPGRAAIVAYLSPLREVPMTQHMIGIPTITLDGDTATATSYAIVTFVRDPEPGEEHQAVHRGLSYDDRLVRTADGWRFAERFHQALWSTTGPTVWPVP